LQVIAVFDGHHSMTPAMPLAAIVLAFATDAVAEGRAGDNKPQKDWCNATAQQLFKVPVVRIAGRVKEPRKLKDVRPRYPKLPSGTVGSGIWVGDALVGPDGRVRKVSVLRDFTFKPPAPQFSAAIVDAIGQWTYTPTLLDGQAVPVCVTVSVNIHWQ
jgi:hypothetical protein